VLTKLAGIAEVARLRPNEKFTSLAHLINADMLRISHNARVGKGLRSPSSGVTSKVPGTSRNLSKRCNRIIKKNPWKQVKSGNPGILALLRLSIPSV